MPSKRPPSVRAYLRTKYVDGAGPERAPLLFVGEAPGENEAKRGMPFVGVTGMIVRDTLTRAGLPADNVRFNNVIPYWMDIPSNVNARRALISKYEAHLAGDLERLDGRVVVACGGLALQRLAPLTETTADRPTLDVSTENGMTYPLSGGGVLVPCRHPAGVMRSKLQAHRMSIAKALERAATYASGAIKYLPQTEVLRNIRIVHNPGLDELRSVLDENRQYDVVAVDTEFERDTFELTSIQVAVGPQQAARRSPLTSTVVVLDRAGWNFETLALITRTLLGARNLVAHNHVAEVQSLATVGVRIARVWYDTMDAFGRLYPDLEQGLNDAVAFYFDHAWNWKTRATDDLVYRALDAHYALHLFYETRQEISANGLSTYIYDEVMPTSVLLWGMTERGLHVDRNAQAALNARLSGEMDLIRVAVAGRADAVYKARIEEARAADAEIENAILEARRNRDWTVEPCSVKKHETYDGLRKKRFARNPECTCEAIYEASAAVREHIATIKKPRARIRGKIKRWSASGFNPGNNDHLRWLLYDQGAFGLPVQKNRETGNPTADADAIDKLLSLPATEKVPGAVELITAIKKYQHLGKMISTFVNPKVDDEGYAHPPMRITTGTGRAASGAGDGGDEDTASEYAFNVLNYPKEIRVIFDG